MELTAIKVFIVLVLGTNGPTTTDAKTLFAQVQEDYRQELQIDLQIKRFVSRRKSPYDRNNLVYNNSRLKHLFDWERFFKRRRNKATLKLALTPALYDKTRLWYLAGYASGTCDYRNDNPVAYVSGAMVNPYGEPRAAHYANAIKHESGHLLGAEHDDSKPQTTMHSNASAYVLDKPLPFSERSKYQIWMCTYND